MTDVARFEQCLGNLIADAREIGVSAADIMAALERQRHLASQLFVALDQPMVVRDVVRLDQIYPRIVLELVDPKELQNDGDPIKEAGMPPICETCGQANGTHEKKCPVGGYRP